MDSLDQPTIGMTKMFYPQWWLESVGYFKIGGNPDGILFQPQPSSFNASTLLAGVILGSLVTLALTHYLTKLNSKEFSKSNQVAMSGSGGYVQLATRNPDVKVESRYNNYNTYQ